VFKQKILKMSVGKKEKINVLSLFDGMSCGQIALNKVGIEYENYFASEIDKYAIQVAKHNYPNTKHIGSVVDVKGSDLPKINLLIGGSPCQGFSFAGKQLNFDDPRSKLFFEFVRLKNECNPTYFLLENVKMKKEYQDVITEHLGVEPIEINSNLLSAQNRKRIYWTNIPGVSIPNDKGILLKDIVHENADNHLSEKEIDYMLRSSGKWSPSTNNRFETYLNYHERKAHCLTANLNKGVPYNCFFEILSEYIVPFDKTLQILDKEVQRGKVGYFRKDSQANRVYYIHDKAITLTGEAGGGAAKMGQYLFGCITPDRIEKRQNGQKFNDGKKFYTLTAQDKHGVLIEGYIRKLTPIECERLQTVPDNYSAIVSNSQRYKMLGNGWTVDVITHIFGGLL
jgi:DNA-cytosine methyltransferase